MKKIFYIFSIIFMFVTSLLAQSDSSKPTLIMDDGQLRSHPVRVFVTNVNIEKEMKPILCLVAINQTTRSKYGNVWCKGPSFKPFEVASDQTISHDVAGTPITVKGTMMLFDLTEISIPIYSAGMRVLPVVTWTAKTITTADNKVRYEYSEVISENEIYIGNGPGGIFWTVVMLLAIIGFVFLLERAGKKRPLDVIRIYDGKISLSLLQMALWSMAVGGMVFAFGLMHLDVPNIPDSLVFLMGLSVVTSAAGHYQTHTLNEIKEESKGNNSHEGNVKKGFFSGLTSMISITTENKEFPSMAKAQYFFWTIAAIVLFVYKSSVEGKLWSVPEELVILMGISQGSYLVRNQMEVNKENKELEKKKEEEKKGIVNK
jgi:hypothetical protein